MAARCATLAVPEPGPAWAGAVIVLARILNGMQSYGHGLGSEKMARLARACADDLRVAGGIMTALRANADAAHVRNELPSSHRAARAATRSRRAAQARPGGASDIPTHGVRRSHRPFPSFRRDAVSRTRTRRPRAQPGARDHPSLPRFQGFPGRDLARPAAEALHSSCAVWSERIVGNPWENHKPHASATAPRAPYGGTNTTRSLSRGWTISGPPR